MTYEEDLAIAVRLYREEVSLADVPEEQLTELPDPVVFGPFEPPSC